jgi:hypothetical protein
VQYEPDTLDITEDDELEFWLAAYNKLGLEHNESLMQRRYEIQTESQEI